MSETEGDRLLREIVMGNYDRKHGERCLPVLCSPWGRFMPHDWHTPPLPWFNSIPEREDQFQD